MHFSCFLFPEKRRNKLSMKAQTLVIINLVVLTINHVE